MRQRLEGLSHARDRTSGRSTVKVGQSRLRFPKSIGKALSMLRPFPILAALAVGISLLALAPSRPVVAAPPSTSAFTNFKVKVADKIVTFRDGGESFRDVNALGTYTITGAIPLTGVDITQFSTDTAISIFATLDEINELASPLDDLITLGQDPRWRPGTKKANIIVNGESKITGRPIQAFKLALKWTDRVLNFTVTGKIDFFNSIEGPFVDDLFDAGALGRFEALGSMEVALEVDSKDVDSPIAGFSGDFKVTGTGSVKDVTVGRGKDAEVFSLSTYNLQGGTTDVVPF